MKSNTSLRGGTTKQSMLLLWIGCAEFVNSVASCFAVRNDAVVLQINNK